MLPANVSPPACHGCDCCGCRLERQAPALQTFCLPAFLLAMCRKVTYVKASALEPHEAESGG